MVEPSDRVREIFEKEVKPMLPKQIKNLKKYKALVEFFAGSARAQTGDGIREAELPKELLPAKHQLNILGRIGVIKIKKPKGNTKSWYDRINNEVYPKWEWGNILQEYLNKMQQHMDDDPEVAAIISEATQLPNEAAREYIRTIDSIDNYTPLTEMLIEKNIPVNDYEYGPLEWRRNPFRYKLEEFFIKLLGGK